MKEYLNRATRNLALTAFMSTAFAALSSSVSAQSAGALRLQVQDLGGRTKTIEISPGTNVIAMATWCPHSKELKSLLNHPAVTSFSHRARTICLFNSDEWDYISVQINNEVQEDSLTKDQGRTLLSQLKE